MVECSTIAPQLMFCCDMAVQHTRMPPTTTKDVVA